MIYSLLIALCLAQTRFLGTQDLEGTGDDTKVRDSLSKLFSDKFSCFRDTGGVYTTWAAKVYGGNHNDAFFCCGFMANGRRQCDLMTKWRKVRDKHFALCETNYDTALNGNNGVRRDLCCQNSQFNDCNLCSSFMVWDFTAPTNSHGGDPILEENLALADGADGKKVTLDKEWRATYNSQSQPEITGTGYPPYAYANNVYPGGFARGTLREFNDPPVCVYAPNVAGRVIEVRVEPEESGSQVCVDDLHEDSLERNTPGVTQACDDVKLQTCFSDANTDDSIDGFAFVISCSESCADGDVDLWFRLRASINKWTESGDASKGTDQTELSTEMWCMWGNQDMRVDGEFDAPTNFEVSGLDGNFAKWDVFPSDLEPDKAPIVRPVQSGVSVVSIAALFSILVLLL